MRVLLVALAAVAAVASGEAGDESCLAAPAALACAGETTYGDPSCEEAEFGYGTTFVHVVTASGDVWVAGDRACDGDRAVDGVSVHATSSGLDAAVDWVCLDREPEDCAVYGRLGEEGGEPVASFDEGAPPPPELAWGDVLP